VSAGPEGSTNPGAEGEIEGGGFDVGVAWGPGSLPDPDVREAPGPMGNTGNMGNDLMETAPVLDGLRVLELGGGVAAAMTARFLHGYGAAVSRFEPTDVSRVADLRPSQRTAYLGGIPIVSGPSSELPALLDRAHMIVSDRHPFELDALGVDFVALRERRPELIVVSVTPFGLTGPNADVETTNAVSFAVGGIMSLTGDPDRAPLLTGGSHAYALGAANAFAAATMAWLSLLRHGHGDLVDISMQECAAGMLEYYGPRTSYMDTTPQLRLGNHTRATWGVYPCLDGWAGVFALARQVPALFALMDDPELDEPRFRDPSQRILPENEEELTAKLYVFFSQYTMAELRELSLKSRVPFGAVLTPADVMAGATPADRGFWDEAPATADRGSGGAVRMPGRPFPGFPWNPARVEGTETLPPSPTAHGAPRLPLAGLRVLDLTMMWAGPFATLRLAEMGAEVIKIESPSAWDNIRTLIGEPPSDEPWNSAYYFNAYNRDKKSLTLDLAQPEGRAVFLRLVEQSDVVIENYRADVLDKLGIGYDELRSRRPDLVLISMAAFGKTGADAEFVGFGPVIEMMSGLCSLTGYGDGEPFKTGISYGDPVAGTFAVSAIGLALSRRLATGEGIHIDLAQRETSAVLIGDAFVDAATDPQPVHRGSRDAVFAPQGCYRLPGEERWLVLSVRSDAEWHSLCALMNRLDLAGLEAAERHARHDDIDTVIEQWLAGAAASSGEDRVAKLREAGIVAMPLLDTRTILDDPHLVVRNFWHETPHPKMHAYRQTGVPWRFADAAPAPRRHSPLFGEHNEEILRGLLGMTDTELSDLAEKNIIATAPINPTVG
jgi:crotonobetainyl-CoA:carnitine CoA-transferase CaiB-like acyl-CoA transferase